MGPAINEDINQPSDQDIHQSTIKTCSQSIIQVNPAINQPANLSVNQWSNQCINQAIDHTSKPSTNLSVNSLTIKNYQSIKPIVNHFNNQLCHSSINSQSGEKELRRNLVITTLNVIRWPSQHHPTLGNVGLRIGKKKWRYYSALFWGEGGGRKIRVVPLKRISWVETSSWTIFLKFCSG